MYIAKQAILTKDHIPDSQSYVFYMDIRATGKGYDEFTRQGPGGVRREVRARPCVAHLSQG